jgi:hypothetical protein
MFSHATTFLLPFLEQTAVAARYDHKRPVVAQLVDLYQTPVEMFSCPSNGHQFVRQSAFASLGMPVGDVFATTDYAYCRGVVDSWCAVPAQPFLPEEQGAFHVGVRLKFKQITDGASQTIAMSEAAGGEHWALCHGPACTNPAGDELDASVPWLMGLPAADILQPFIMSSIFGCTLEPMNKRPVTNTMISLAGMADCNSSAHGGPHTTSNFRSDHPRGAQFLLLDGSIRFTDDSIDLTTYRRLSTIAEGVPAPFP